MDPDNISLKPEEYIQSRVEDQIHWFYRKSDLYLQRHRRLNNIQFFAAGLIPLFIGLHYFTNYAWMELCAFGSSFVVLFTFLITANFRYYETSIEYKKLASTLKKELIYFTTNSGPYQLAAPTLFNDVVITVERILWDSARGQT